MDKYDMHRRTIRVSADSGEVFTTHLACGGDHRSEGVEMTIIFDPDNPLHEFLFDRFMDKRPFTLEIPPLTPAVRVVVLWRSSVFEEGIFYDTVVFGPAP